MRLALAAMLIGISLGNTADKHTPVKPPVESFTHKYFVQLDKTNAALRDFSNTPCNAEEFTDSEKKFRGQYDLLLGMYKAIPLAENDIDKAHEIEAMYGLQILAKDVIDEQVDCIKNRDNDPKTHSENKN